MAAQSELVTPVVNVLLTIVRALIANRKTAGARDLVEAVRIACDELTGEINEASRK